LEQGEEDLKRTGIAAVVASGVVLALQGSFLHGHWQSAMWFTFALGYIGIIFEEVKYILLWSTCSVVNWKYAVFHAHC
jgi:hypothetical protein